jgi:glycine dehydrogenase subunit 1
MNGIHGGIKIAEDQIMFAVTEKRSKEEIDRMVEIMPLYKGVH